MNDTNFKHNAELNRTISEYKNKILDEKREHEKKISSLNSEFHQKTKTLELTINDQRKTISNLLSQMTKLSNDAVVVISNLKRRKGLSSTTKPQVIDQTCEVCNGRGKNKEKTQCPTCNGRGFTLIHGTKERRYWLNDRQYTTYDYQKRCELCGGKGYLIKFKTCSPCNGVGRIPIK